MLSSLIVGMRGFRRDRRIRRNAGVNRSRLFGAFVVLVLSAGAAAAQSAAPPIVNPAVEMRADIAAARGQEKSAAATRQQIQAIRAALRARFAALHH
jgi:hypothetical protein